jgi:amino acid transporter
MQDADQDRRQAELLESFGYKQELNRAMGAFSSFAVSFSGVSITTAIFVLLAFLYTQAGSAGLWTWIPSSIGAFLVALVFADLVGRIPVAGYAYQWSSRLTNARLGWFVAVCGLIGFAVGAAGTIYGVTPYFLDEFGITITRNANIFGAIILTSIVLVVNIAGIKLITRINNFAVVTEIVGGMGVAIVIFIYAIIKHPHSAGFLFHREPGGHGAYIGSFILAFLIGAFTYAAWELPADMAEETKDAPNTAARTMLMSVVAVAISGMVLLVGYTYAAPDIKTVANSSTPVLDVIDYQWGSAAKRAIDVIFLVSFFAVSLLIMAGAARLLFSLSRDNMAPLSSVFSRVSTRWRTPWTALTGVAIFAVGMFTIPALISSTALAYVIGTASVGYNLVYALVAGIFVWKLHRGTLPPQHGRFALGRWAAPVGWAALIWQIFLVGTLTIPKINQNVGWTTGAMLLVGALWYIIHVHSATGRGTAGPRGAAQREEEARAAAAPTT